MKKEGSKLCGLSLLLQTHLPKARWLNTAKTTRDEIIDDNVHMDMLHRVKNVFTGVYEIASDGG